MSILQAWGIRDSCCAWRFGYYQEKCLILPISYQQCVFTKVYLYFECDLTIYYLYCGQQVNKLKRKYGHVISYSAISSVKFRRILLSSVIHSFIFLSLMFLGFGYNILYSLTPTVISAWTVCLFIVIMN